MTLPLRHDEYLAPKLLQIFGMSLFLAAAVFWAVTGRESLTIMSGALSLIAVGAYQRAFQSLRNGQLLTEPPVQVSTDNRNE
jgi:hypothetical protein